jgi:hypothetical protein
LVVFWRIVLTAMMAAAMAFAQGGPGGMGGDMGGGGMRGGERGGGMDGGMGGGGGMRPQRQSPFDVFSEKLKLSKDQRTEAETIVQDALKEMAPIEQQLQQARQNLAGVLINGQSDQADQLLKSYAPLASQTAAIEAKAFAKICKMLKPNQEKNAGQAFQVLAEMLDRPRAGGSRGGDRRER